MMYFRKHILFAVFLFVWASMQAQLDPSVISRIEDGKIVLQLDFRWTEAQRSEVEELFNLDSTLWEIIYPASSEVILDSVKWDVKHLSQFVMELSKNIDNNPISHFNENDIFLLEENFKVAPGYVDQDKVVVGANQFKYNSGFEYGDGKARFYLPGYIKTKQVFISGSFNNWSHFQTPLQRVDTGWVATIPLLPGKYFYK